MAKRKTSTKTKASVQSTPTTEGAKLKAAGRRSFRVRCNNCGTTRFYVDGEEKCPECTRTDYAVL